MHVAVQIRFEGSEAGGWVKGRWGDDAQTVGTVRKSLLIRGDDIQRMSRELGISVHTVRSYVRSLLRKLDCRTQLQAVIRALQLGLITLDDV